MSQPPSGQRPDHHYTPRQQKKERIAIRRACFILTGVFALLLIYGGIQLALRQRDIARTEQINRENLALLGTDSPAPSPAVTAAPEQTPPASPEPEASGTPAAGTSLPGTQTPSVRIVRGSPSPRPAVQGKFDDLLARNGDTVGWLKAEALYRVDFAVVQKDNSFYMDHDFTRASNREGAAFLDETNSLWPRDDHLIIYAHNMKSGSMFGELNQLGSRDVLFRHPFISFDTLYENSLYIPYAVVNCNVADQTADDYFNFYLTNFRTTGEFSRFLAKARTLSMIDLTQVDVRFDDALLTLSTCFDEANRTRFLVMLRRLRPDETRESVQAAFFPDAGR